MQSAGQSVIYTARNAADGNEYAVKFFLSMSAFATAGRLYRRPALAALLPRIEEIWDNSDGSMRTAEGRLLPPCVVMEKGESLVAFMARLLEPDQNLALRVRSLYANTVH
jgi:hypothetical protein